ncbi:condensation domain-containing protein [Micromonospora sp. NPDC050187]|uniref:condensation domain-containing protein n=1 Tax=Micromonospora sp. NPDC050187 TaxID=3364277 RepID=UPI003799ED93
MTRHIRTVHLFAGGTRTSRQPATWGQQYIYEAVESLRFEDSRINVELPVPIGAGVSVSEALMALRLVVERHESLRTTYTRSPDGELVQHVTEGQLFEVDIWECGVDDLRESRNALLARYKSHVFDPAVGPLFRCALLTRDGAPRYLLLVTSHMVLDDWSGTLVSREYTALLAGATLPAATWQPLEQAGWEASEPGRRLHERSIRYWRDTFATAPRFPRQPDLKASASPRYWHGQLTSPEAFDLLGAHAAQLGVTGPSLLVAAYGLAFARFFDTDEVLMMVRTANRPTRESLASVGHYSQQVPVRLRTDHPTFAEYARHAHDRILDAYPYGLCAPGDAEREMFAGEFNRWARVTVNITPEVPVAPDTARDQVTHRARQRHFGWLSNFEEDRIVAYCDIWPAIQSLSLFADTAFIPKRAVGAVLEEIEGIILKADG